jgi:hypothetical protein
MTAGQNKNANPPPPQLALTTGTAIDSGHIRPPAFASTQTAVNSAKRNVLPKIAPLHCGAIVIFGE